MWSDNSNLIQRRFFSILIVVVDLVYHVSGFEPSHSILSQISLRLQSPSTTASMPFLTHRTSAPHTTPTINPAVRPQRHPLPQNTPIPSTTNLHATPQIDLQSDTTLYGRGEMHLSAALTEGDVVAYHTGSWEVDGVTVGDNTDEPPGVGYCRVDTLQIVWTHNCEHGFVRGIAVDVGDDGNGSGGGVIVVEQSVGGDGGLVFVEFGPEQLVARLPVDWAEGGERGSLLVPLPEELGAV